MTDNRIWILGAPDPEMELIEKLLRECGEEYIYALDDRGERVHPGNAYRCPVPEVPEGSTVYAVECTNIFPEGWVRIDHHRPGDPGYGRPPAEFLAASSIGQVIATLARSTAGPVLLDGLQDSALWRPGEMAPCQEKPGGFSLWHGQWVVGTVNPRMGGVGRFGHYLGWGVPQDLVLAAAADHCLAAAYAGECPGVAPEALVKWRAETRAAHQGRSADDVLADVERARYLLRDECPRVALSLYHTVIDARRIYRVPELSEAAFRDGKTYITTVVDRDGREKVVLGGCTTPEVVRAFMEQWAPGEGLEDIYGDPERGFAGGYLSA